MAVTAVAHDGTPEVFYQASKWHIDETGGLHIIGPSNKHVGAFAVGKWSYVIDNEATTEPDAQVHERDIVVNNPLSVKGITKLSRAH